MANFTAEKKRAIALFAAGIAVIAAGAAIMLYGKGSGERRYTSQTFAMDAPCTIEQYGSGDFSAVKERIAELDEEISAYNEKGEICALNENKSGTLSEDCKSLLTEYLGLYEQYGEVNPLMGGIISLWDVNGENPGVPGSGEISAALETADTDNICIEGNSCTLKNGASLNFGAAGKGFALDEVKKTLEDLQLSCAVVSFGSSTLLYGQKPDGSDFKVAVTDPGDDSAQLLTFTCGEGFVSTSGGYERFFEADGKRYIHIFDENTGYPAETDLTSVTVICQSGIKSDFLSTRIFIGGTEELDRWLCEETVQVIAADENNNVYCSDSLKDSITLLSDEYKFK